VCFRAKRKGQKESGRGRVVQIGKNSQAGWRKEKPKDGSYGKHVEKGGVGGKNSQVHTNLKDVKRKKKKNKHREGGVFQPRGGKKGGDNRKKKETEEENKSTSSGSAEIQKREKTGAARHEKQKGTRSPVCKTVKA